MNKITYEQRREIYESAIRKFGVKNQIVVAIEEMSELTKELCKSLRWLSHRDNLAEEIADVTIMLEQLRIILEMNDDVCDFMDKKILRLKERIGE